MDTTVVIADAVDARVGPLGSLENLSQAEIAKLLDTSAQGLYPLFRNCALAVLNAGSDSDNAHEIMERYRSFTVQIVRHAWGIKLQVSNAPAAAFVDGEMIRGIKEHLFAVLRDVIYTANEIVGTGRLEDGNPAAITNALFHILRNARVLDSSPGPTWRCAGADTRSARANTSTPSASATSSGSVASTSAPAAAQGR